ncbi:MAG: hypothetical protein DWQ10_10090, partial [Calditrichaeota bacterium]
MKKLNLFARLLITLFLVSTGLNGQQIEQKDGYFTLKITKSFNVKPGGRINIRVANGYYEIQGWDKNEVAVEEVVRSDEYSSDEAERVISRSKAEYEHSGADVRIFSRGSAQSVFHSFKLKIPRKYDIKLKTSRGDVEVLDISGDIDVSTAGGDIRILHCGGEVEAKTSGGDVEIHDTKAEIDAHTSGGDIKIENVDGEVDASTSGGDIDLVNTNRSARIRTSGGNLVIRNAQGDVRGTTSGGSITAENCKKDIKIHTSGGSIELRDMVGFVDASTSGGDIEGKNLRGACELNTSGGDIKLEQVQNSVQAKTMGGTIEVEMTVTDFSQNYSVDLLTVSGDIVLEIPEKLPATIHAEIRLDRNRRYWKRYDILSDFPLTKKTTSENQ